MQRPTAPPEQSATNRRTLGIGLAIVSGVAMSLQSKINGALSAELNDSLLAAALSFGGGFLVLLVAFGSLPTMRKGLRRFAAALRAGSVRPWQCLGGVAGAIFVVAQSITVAVVGVAMFTVGVVGGQTVSGLFVDKAGLGPSGRQLPSASRVLGAMLTIAAVVTSVFGDLVIPGHAGNILVLFLPLAGGAVLAWQQAVNGQVGVAAGSPLTAALINFAVGTVALVVACLVSVFVHGLPSSWPDNPLLYVGGLVGVVFIGLAALVVKWTGVLVLGLSAVAGQLIGSVLLDVFIPAQGVELATSTVVGAGVALVAIGIAAAGGHRADRAVLRE